MRAIDADAIAYESIDSCDTGRHEHYYGTGIIAVRKEDIDAMPTIQPKRGRWIYCEDSTADCVDGYRCDQCGFFVPWDYKHKSIDYIKDYNFCPMCGSYNGGEKE